MYRYINMASYIWLNRTRARDGSGGPSISVTTMLSASRLLKANIWELHLQGFYMDWPILATAQYCATA
jgi:hypothetical protein